MRTFSVPHFQAYLEAPGHFREIAGLVRLRYAHDLVGIAGCSQRRSHPNQKPGTSAVKLQCSVWWHFQPDRDSDAVEYFRVATRVPLIALAEDSDSTLDGDASRRLDLSKCCLVRSVAAPPRHCPSRVARVYCVQITASGPAFPQEVRVKRTSFRGRLYFRSLWREIEGA